MASQQAAAAGKDGSSNAAVAARLLSIEALSAKLVEWAPEVGTAVLHSCTIKLLQKHDKAACISRVHAVQQKLKNQQLWPRLLI